MDEWRKDARRDVVITDIDALVPEDHLLRKIEWDTFSAADIPADSGNYPIPLVFRIWVTGEHPTLCDSELCVLQAIPAGTGRRDI